MKPAAGVEADSDGGKECCADEPMPELNLSGDREGGEGERGPDQKSRSEGGAEHRPRRVPVEQRDGWSADRGGCAHHAREKPRAGRTGWTDLEGWGDHAQERSEDDETADQKREGFGFEATDDPSPENDAGDPPHRGPDHARAIDLIMLSERGSRRHRERHDDHRRRQRRGLDQRYDRYNQEVESEPDGTLYQRTHDHGQKDRGEACGRKSEYVEQAFQGGEPICGHRERRLISGNGSIAEWRGGSV